MMNGGCARARARACEQAGVDEMKARIGCEKCTCSVGKTYDMTGRVNLMMTKVFEKHSTAQHWGCSDVVMYLVLYAVCGLFVACLFRRWLNE